MPAVNSNRGEIFRNFLFLFSGNVLARLLLILGMPLLAKYFNPDEIGQWQLYLAIVAVLTPLISWKYEIAFVLPKSDVKAQNLLFATICILLVSTSVWVVVFYFFSPTMARLLKFDFLVQYGWLIPVVSFAYAIDQCWMFWLTRRSQFMQQVPGRIVQSLAMVAIPIVLVTYTELSVYALIVGSVFAQFLATLIITYFSVDRSLSPQFVRFSEMRESLREYKSYPLFVTPYNLLSQASVRFLIFLLAYVATTTEVGLFSMSLQLTLIPVTFIGISLSKALYPKFANSLHEIRTHELIVKVLSLMIVMATPWAVIFSFYSTELFQLVLGQEWIDAGRYAAWLCPPSLLLLFTSWLNRIYDVMGRQKLEFILQIVYSAALFIIIGIFLNHEVDIFFFVKIYSVLTVIFYISWLIIGFWIAKIELKKLLGPGMLLLTVIVSTYMACSLVNGVSYTYALSLLLGGLVGVQALALFMYQRVGRNREVRS